MSAPLFSDVEAPARPAAKQVPDSTWYAALGQAVQYVWPKQVGLQVRALSSPNSTTLHMRTWPIAVIRTSGHAQSARPSDGRVASAAMQ